MKARWFTIAMALALTGCGSTKVVQHYEGKARPERDVATVIVPFEVDLQFVDGERIALPTRFGGNKELEIKLLPGPHELEARYYMPTTAAGTDDRSNPYVIRFQAEAGRVYRIAFRSEQEGRRTKWVLGLQDAQTQRAVAELPKSAMPWNAPEPAVAVLAQPSSARLAAPGAKPLPQDVRAITALDQLRYWWTQAEAEEREAFLKWLVLPSPAP